MCNVGRVARAGAANLRERWQSGTVTRPSTIQCLHYNLLNIVARPPTVLCVYLLSTTNDSGRVVMRLDMVYAPSSINYNLYPPSYIPPSIQNNCKKSQFVTSKITVKSHKMWLVIIQCCIQCWSFPKYPFAVVWARLQPLIPSLPLSRSPLCQSKS